MKNFIIIFILLLISVSAIVCHRLQLTHYIYNKSVLIFYGKSKNAIIKWDDYYSGIALYIEGQEINSLERYINLKNISSLILHNTNIKDLSPIKNMQLQRLSITQTPIEDLSPIKNMQLQRLSITQTPIEDLSPIGKTNIKKLSIAAANIKDVRALSHLKLTAVMISYCPNLTNIEGLGQETIRQVCLFNLPVSDISPLKTCSNLTNLSLRSLPVSDLSPISKLSLQILNIEDCPISDLTPILNNRYRQVILEKTLIKDEKFFEKKLSFRSNRPRTSW